MTQGEWDEFCFRIRDQMTDLVGPSVTPISKSDDMERGWAHGTGSYLRLPSGMTVLLTNEHVASGMQTGHLSHLPAPGSHYHLLRTCKVRPEPEDLAVCSIPDTQIGGERRVLEMASLDAAFTPVPGELVYWLGFPGTKASRHEAVFEHNTRYSWFGELETVGVPMISQQVPTWSETLPDRLSPTHHAIIHYPTWAKRSLNEPKAELPNPEGLSGSLLWDTKAVACLRRGQPWDASKARVCGVVWAILGEMVVATKVELLHAFIADVDSTGAS